MTPLMKSAALAALAALSALSAPTLPALAQVSHKVVVAYQTGPDPIEVGIVDGTIAKQTGYEIDFRRFNSGAEIFAAIASGDVQVGYVGSSPFAAATSRGLAVQAFLVPTISGTDEALVVREGAGIASPADLRGKRLSAAPVSTDHYQLLATLAQAGVKESDATVIPMPQPQIVAAWKRGDLDAAFVWNPALTELKKNGHVLLTSKQVAEAGAPTFNAWVTTADFAKDNAEFLKGFAGLVARYNADFVKDRSAWGADSAHAKAIAGLLGGTPADAANGLALLNILTPAQQASDQWLGGGEASGVARILKATAGFLKDQKKITAVNDSYAAFATADYVKPLAASQ